MRGGDSETRKQRAKKEDTPTLLHRHHGKKRGTVAYRGGGFNGRNGILLASQRWLIPLHWRYYWTHISVR